jgi:hypothetical protein
MATAAKVILSYGIYSTFWYETCFGLSGSVSPNLWRGYVSWFFDEDF